MSILVRAVFPNGGFGFDGLGRRRDGDEFTIDESIFDASWMEKVEKDKPPALKDATKKPRKPRTKKAEKTDE